MSAARRSSYSSSSRRYSHSSTPNRHSHSRCCSTAEGHGIRIVYLLGAKLQKFAEMLKFQIVRPAKGGIKREGAASLWVGSPSVVFRKTRFAFYALRGIVHEHALAPEGQPHAEARKRARPGAIRIRVRQTATRTRVVARPQRDTAAPC